MLSKIDAYRMTKTQTMPNIKEIAGSDVLVTDIRNGEYFDRDGSVHHVLSVRLDNGEMYRTEVGSFIEDLSNFIEAFPDLEDRPKIHIEKCVSKRGNEYIRFSVCGE